jgi:3-phenylpropionate/trans-cinnamate dioxygenase ferredoxin reductase component
MEVRVTSAGAGQTFVVVGASMAGASAVEGLRREGYAGRLALVGAEPHLPYERPPLSKGLLTGATPEASIFPRDAAFYAEQGIELRLGTRAVTLNPAARTVALSDGVELRFDRLLIATGGEARRLAAPGADLPGVFHLRTLEEARALAAGLHEQAAQGGRVVVVGAGFIGAEVAAGCRQLGIAVTMLEILPTPLGRVLGDEVGAIYADIHRAHGVDLRLGEGIGAIRGAGRVEEVVTAAGATIPCELVVVGVGMRPADAWLRGAGLALGDGVLVDAFCETSAQGIFAAGDVANWPYGPSGERVRLEHYDNALRQGEAAARNMLGQRRPFTSVPYFWSDQYDMKLQYVGHAHAEDQVVLRGRLADGPFMAFYLRAGRLRAALAVNRVRELATLKRLVAADIAPDPEALADEESNLRSLAPSPA